MPLARRSLLVALSALVTLPVLAQSPLPWRWPDERRDPALAGLEALLAQTPVSLVTPGTEWVELGFSDFHAARGVVVGGNPDRPLALRQMVRAVALGGISLEFFGVGGDWRQAIGLQVEDLRQLLMVSVGRRFGTVMQLQTGAGDRVAPALAGRGYARQSQGGVDAQAVGEDGSISIEARDLSDPFRGPLGRSSRVQVEGDVLRHATTWPLIAALVHAGRAPALSDPGIVALLDGLAGIDAGPLVSVVLMPDAGQLAGEDPFLAVSGRATPGGPQGWRGMLFADFTTGPQSTAVMVATLPWPEGEALEPLVETVARRWDSEPMRDSTMAERLGPVQIDAVRMASGLVRLRLRLSAPTDTNRAGFPRNAAHEGLLAISRIGQYPFLP